jgi:hypothetical protein
MCLLGNSPPQPVDLGRRLEDAGITFIPGNFSFLILLLQPALAAFLFLLTNIG